MPIPILSPKHSFVSFTGGLSGVVLPAYNGADIAFQFTFPAESAVPLNSVHTAGIANVNGADVSTGYAVQNICAWGGFEGIDLAMDFPATVSTFPLKGTYDSPKAFLAAVRTMYNLSATGQTFMQCCSLDALPDITFGFSNANYQSKSARIRFYKGLQWVKIEAGFNQLPIAVGQCFRYFIRSGSDTVLSNTFERVDSDRFLTRVKYSNNEDAYGFMYRQTGFTSVKDAIPPTTGRQGVVGHVASRYWNCNGARIYAEGFPLNGRGTVMAELKVPHLWVNGEVAANALGTPTSNLVDGRMNENGIWLSGYDASVAVWLPVNEWIGFSRKVYMATGKRVFIGVAGDDVVKLKINGSVILDTTNNGVNQVTWSIYPIDLPAGWSFIEMAVMNLQQSISANPAGFGCEIYDMTYEQLTAATTKEDLNIIFGTKEVVGGAFDIGSSVGYSCEEGWILSKNEDGSYSCIKIQQGEDTYNELCLPILSKKPKYPERRKVYIKSNNQYKVQSAVIEKEWECKTEDLPDEFHEKAAVMLAHDNIHFTNYFINDFVTKKDDYTPDWQDDDLSISATATFKVNTPFEGRNSNCEKRVPCAPVLSPVECIALDLNTSFVLPDAVVGTEYVADQPIVGGTTPYTVAVVVKPEWMTVNVVGNMIQYRGTPTSAATNVPVQISVSNCGGSVPYSDAINVTVAQTNDPGVLPAYVDWVDFIGGDASYDEEEAHVSGDGGATVTFTLTTYTNSNGGTLKANNSEIYQDQTLTVLLDANGQGSFRARIDGDPNNPGTVIRGIFTITHTTSGTIGENNNTFQISKVF